MQENVQDLLKKLNSYISTTVFGDNAILMRNLKSMKFNTDLEWFNCALISIQMRNGKNSVVVNQKKHWEELINRELQLIDQYTSPVTLILPKIDSENGKFNVVVDNVDTYYLSDFENIAGIKYLRKTAIKNVLEKYEHYLDLLKILHNDWQTVLLTSYLETFDFYLASNTEMKKYYLSILKVVFGEELKIEKIEKIPVLKNKAFDLLAVYKNIWDSISSFHIAYDMYLTALCEVYREIEYDIDKDVTKTIGYEKLVNMANNLDIGKE